MKENFELPTDNYPCRDCWWRSDEGCMQPEREYGRCTFFDILFEENKKQEGQLPIP